MKKTIFLLGLICTFFISCDKFEAIDEDESQQVVMFYSVSFSIMDRGMTGELLPNEGYVQPQELYRKLGEEIYNYSKNKAQEDNNPAIAKGYYTACTPEDFEATIKQSDATAIMRQKSEAKKFEDYYKNRIEPLLEDVAKYGDGEFTVRLKFAVERKEMTAGSAYRSYDANGKLIKEIIYEPFGEINGIPIDQTIGEPIIFEIKYKYPE